MNSSLKTRNILLEGIWKYHKTSSAFSRASTINFILRDSTYARGQKPIYHATLPCKYFQRRRWPWLQKKNRVVTVDDKWVLPCLPFDSVLYTSMQNGLEWPDDVNKTNKKTTPPLLRHRRKHLCHPQEQHHHALLKAAKPINIHPSQHHENLKNL